MPFRQRLLLAAAMLCMWSVFAATLVVNALPPKTWASPIIPKPVKVAKVGETFRSGSLGYTVYGTTIHTGAVSVSVKIHNPGPGDHRFDSSWLLLEDTQLRVTELDVLSTMSSNPTYPGYEIPDGKAFHLALVFVGEDVCGRLLVGNEKGKNVPVELPCK